MTLWQYRNVYYHYYYRIFIITYLLRVCYNLPSFCKWIPCVRNVKASQSWVTRVLYPCRHTVGYLEETSQRTHVDCSYVALVTSALLVCCRVCIWTAWMVYDSRIPEGSTPVHAAGYGCTVRLLRRLVELGGDVRLHDINGLMVRHWAARQLNVSRRSKNLTYLLYAQNRALSSVGRPPVDAQVSSPRPSVTASAQQRPTLASSRYLMTYMHLLCPCPWNGHFQTPISVPVVRPKRCHTLSNPAHRQDYTVACLNYTLQTMMPLPGWPVMAPKCIRQQHQRYAHAHNRQQKRIVFRSSVCSSIHQLPLRLCINTCLTWRNIYLLCGQILMKLATNIYHVSGYCWKGCHDRTNQLLMAETCILTLRHQGLLAK